MGVSKVGVQMMFNGFRTLSGVLRFSRPKYVFERPLKNVSKRQVNAFGFLKTLCRHFAEVMECVKDFFIRSIVGRHDNHVSYVIMTHVLITNLEDSKSYKNV